MSPAVFGDFFYIDDVGMVSEFASCKNLYDKISTFLSDGPYFRPVVGISFALHKYIGGYDPVVMRFVNVLLHIANSYLLFAYLNRFFKTSILDFKIFIIVSIFAVHPIVSEPVSWVSARGDLLAVFFFLISIYLQQIYETNGRISFLIASFITLFLSVLSKESTLLISCIYPIFWLYINWYKCNKTYVINYLRLVLFMYLVLILLFIFGQSYGLYDIYDKIRLTKIVMLSDSWRAWSVFLGVIGFYTGKLIFPWPLNFFIGEIDPLYEIIGFLTILLSVLFIIKSTNKYKICLILLYMISISTNYPLAFNQISWAPYAERYCYVPLLLFVIFIASMIWDSNVHKYIYVSLAVIICVFTFACITRLITYQTNLTLWEDVTSSNENYSQAYNDYAISLKRNGSLEKAIENFEVAINSTGTRYNPVYDYNYGILLLEIGKVQESYDAFKRSWLKSNGSFVKSKFELDRLLDRDRVRSKHLIEEHDSGAVK